MFRSFFLSVVTMTVAFCLEMPLPLVPIAALAWLAPEVAAAFVGFVEKGLITLCYAGERAAFILFQ